VKEKSIIYSP